MKDSRKAPNMWILTGVTYGAVILVTIFSLVAYHYLLSGKEEPARSENTAVGTVWVPMYPGAVVHDTRSSKHGDITEGTMNFGSKDSADAVLSFYRTRLRKNGFQLEANTDVHTVRAVGRAGKAEVTVSVDSQRNGSEAQIATIDREKK